MMFLLSLIPKLKRGVHMPNVDYPITELKSYRPDSTAQKDFDDFWQQQQVFSKQQPLNAVMTSVDYPIKSIEVFHLKYDGIDGTPIHGWYLLPRSSLANRPMSVYIHYHGYTGNASRPIQFLPWLAMGMAVISLDVRGQSGKTSDHAKYPSGAVIGWMTLGIEDPQSYYYKYVYMDCVRAIDFVQTREELDIQRIVVGGESQGGGITLAVAGIDPRPKLATPIFPYLADFRRGVEQHVNGPYVEIKNWFRAYDPEHLREEEIYRNLSYFDAMNHASRVKAKTLMAITLQDLVTPPSTCFAAYNHLICEKECKIYHDHGHEPLPFHTEAMLKFIEKNL
jgi:cephalosporin-C deacetylase